LGLVSSLFRRESQNIVPTSRKENTENNIWIQTGEGKESLVSCPNTRNQEETGAKREGGEKKLVSTLAE